MAHAHYFALRYMYATELKVGGGLQVLMHSILTGYIDLHEYRDSNKYDVLFPINS